MRRCLLIWFGCVMLCVLAGCSSSRDVRVRDQVDRENSAIHREGGQPISGYVTIDGRYHGIKGSGHVRLATPDTLEFIVKSPPSYLAGVSSRTSRFRIPRDSVQTISATYTSPVKTTFAVIGITVAVAAVALAIAVATKESCPFLYSWDGRQFVFDGEPYGGATMKGLERTDWSKLEHLVPVHGTYRMLLTNEVDETQHTNSISLLVVNHPPGSTVVMDREGRPHAFLRLLPILAARDETGRDLERWLREDDAIAWEPNLKEYCRLDTLPDPRNHITLVFPRPTGVAHVYLVSNVATHEWGSHMIRTMLAMRGNRIEEFYAAINGSDLYRKQLLDWNAREELFELFPEIQCGTAWERQDFIPAGGPFIGESRAVPLDLSRVEGDTLRIRIHPPIGFWSLNSFHLAWEEAETQETRLAAEAVRGPDSPDLLARLLSDDDRYLDFAKTGDRTEVVFQAPRERSGMDRTIFARTRGWYEVHLHDLVVPDVAGLARLTGEPGYAVRRSLREFADYQRTGALLGVEKPRVAP